MNKYYTVKEVAKIEGVTVRRIVAKIKQGHYKNCKKCPCNQAWLIPKNYNLLVIKLVIDVPKRCHEFVEEHED